MYKYIVTGIFFLVLLLSVFQRNIIASDNGKILETDHFIIKSELKSGSHSIAFAQKLETYHGIITSFIEYEPLQKTNVLIIQEKNFSAFLPDLFITGNQLIINSDEHFYDPENILYNKLFISYLEKSMNSRSPSSVLDNTFLNSLLNYSISGSNVIGVVVNDLVNNMGLLTVDLKNIRKYKSSIQEIIYTAFIEYIISTYGKSILTQSVKDAYYYDNIFNALSIITGTSGEDIVKGFNHYLSGYKNSVNKNEIKKILDTGDNEYTNISFAILKNDIAVLQKNKETYRILLKNSTGSRIIELKHSEKDSSFNDVIFIKNNSVIVTEIINKGSVILIYDINSKKINNKFILPYMYLTSSCTDDENYLIFTALCGQYSDIYMINLLTGRLDNITESGNNYYPVKIKDRLYCISVTDKCSIIEIIKHSGEVRTLFSTNQKISDLSVMDENYLIFTMEMNGISNIYRLNVQGKNLSQITNGRCLNHTPRFLNNKIYYFSYHKSRYRIFFMEYNAYN